MDTIGQREKETQKRVIKLFKEELSYNYLGDWTERPKNSNIEEEFLSNYLVRKGYSQTQINKAIYELKRTSINFNDSLYTTNKNVYQSLRYGVKVKANVGENYETIKLINWSDFSDNDFAIAEEVTITGNLTKRPDIVIYVNGIALGVIELKRGIVDIGEGIRQNITNQQDRFIQPFFTTVQFIFAGNDSEGLRYGTINTPEKYYLNWKEDIEDNSRLLLDKYLLKMCSKERFIELIYNFVLFDGGVKKVPRVNQYFGIKEAQKFINRYESGILWHTQGSGKSIIMVLLAKWILANNPKARVVVLTDRTELDKQIQGVFEDAGETIYRTKSGKDLMSQLGEPSPRLLCSLIHKFGKKDVTNFNKYIEDLIQNPIDVIGELFVFIDECHRTHGGKLNRAMKAMLPNAVFIGFTGTPLLKADKKSSLEVFGKYIHTYKFNEAVIDKVILDLMYDPRDIDQKITSQKKIDEWFEAKTKGLNDFQKFALKKKWGTMQHLLSSQSRMDKIVKDIIFDFGTKPRLSSECGNAILVTSSINDACKYYTLFQKTGFKNQCAVITSYSPNKNDITTEDIGANTETDKEAIYNLYEELLKDIKVQPNKTKTESYEDWAKLKFQKEPANMKLLIVVSKLLVGFNAPTCTYIYLDKKMQDHGLFQAICRVNRLDTDDKEFGYIVDYQNLFQPLGDAMAVYTSELDADNFNADDINVLLKDRLKAGKERLEGALEELALLCEPVKPPKGTLEYIQYFCGNTEIEDDLKSREPQRIALYRNTVSLVRAYANIADDIDNLGYSTSEITKINTDIDFYAKLRQEIKQASGETIDLKSYEADMRHLLDTYIQAEDPENISPFGDMSLLEIIENSGIADAISSLGSGIRKNRGAVAEAIENNIRSKIINERLTNPAFFEKMSKLLEALIIERKEDAISYEEYLKKIAILAKQANAGKTDDTPDILKTPALRALYSFLNSEGMALVVDEVVRETKKDGWRGNSAKEQEIKYALYMVTNDHEQVEKLFNLIKEQKEY
ncbi:type I restriction endonuclease subunit R [Lutibacter maritimus]|uniref:Type I restriction enzyme endonuclease subunit n=1 Tax=Lutibacter maritimus TaxID=593133 RepID=A0A1I6RES7_9FLAO|nr:HsdR family type I site-specific deoxyribonuclease [Lutibacter maritimus]SFS63174.1 type I restriction enzyme, R subunit [Lutibacter maritimus]